MPCLIATIAFALVASAQATETDPITKVVEMITDLQGKIISQASSAQKEYDSYVAYCQERSQSIAFEVKSAKGNKESLQANIEEETATIGTLQAKIEDLASDMASDETDLKRATVLREQESAEFASEESDLKDISDALERAISHFSKNGQAALLQVKEVSSVTEALNVMVDATAMSSEDASRLTALVQERSLEKTEESDSDADADSLLGAPAAATYESHSAGVMGTLQTLYDRAEAQLSKVREAEAVSRQNYQRLKQSIEDEIKLAKQDMHAAKAGAAESQEAASVATGDLEATSKDLEQDIVSKEELHHECMTAAHEFQSTVNARQNEINALAAAKKAIEDNSGGASTQTYMAQVSFTQVASHSESQSIEVVHFVRKLASRTKSASLAQLASRMSSALRLGTVGSLDPFAKIKGLISGMISQLEAEGDAETSHKQYCDKQTSLAQAQNEDTSAELSSLGAKQDQKKAASVKTKELIATLHKELASIARFKAGASLRRQEEEAVFRKNSAEMQKGLNGIRLALKILKEKYGKALGGITSLLEVAEADFSQGLAVLVADEETAANYYADEVKRNYELEAAAKEADMQYKIKEYRSMDKTLSETSSDISNVQTRLNAILEFDSMIKKSCTSLPLSYDGRKGRREEEIAGLKQAAENLEGTAFLEMKSSHKLRGARHRG